MEYHEAVNSLERLRRLRPKLGTETTASLLEHLGDPHEGTPAVQVAGSNGKGSTARMLARILREAGLTVGLYTSPDLNGLRERVRVGDRKIPKPEVVRFVEAAWPYVIERSVEGDAPTFFEAFTALALWHFDRADVDVAVLEVGIGGRYDATSVVDPVAAAVTSVSLEHTDLLGETVEEIARDKAHVAPADAPLVTGATGAALEAVRERTEVLTVGTDGTTSRATDDDRDASDAPDVLATEGGMVSFAESALSLAGPDWAVETRTPLLGRHQALNAGIAAVLARQLGAATGTAVTEGDIAAGIRNVHWPGRFELMDREPLTVLDGAHNPDACAKLAALLDRFEFEDLHLVFGAMRDKDHAAMCRSLPSVDRVYLAEPAVDRAHDVDALAAVFDRETDAETERCGSVLDALEAAVDAAGPSDCVLVAGSLYTVGEARDRWTRAPRAVRADTPSRARAVMERADVPAVVRETRAERVVDRTVRLHARRGEAAELKEAMLSLGGTAAVSGITTADEHVEVVLDGSLEAFRRLVADLRDGGGSEGRIAGELADALGFGGERRDVGRTYPWGAGTAVMGVLDVPSTASDASDGGGSPDAVEAAVSRGRGRHRDARGAAPARRAGGYRPFARGPRSRTRPRDGPVGGPRAPGPPSGVPCARLSRAGGVVPRRDRGRRGIRFPGRGGGAGRRPRGRRAPGPRRRDRNRRHRDRRTRHRGRVVPGPSRFGHGTVFRNPSVRSHEVPWGPRRDVTPKHDVMGSETRRDGILIFCASGGARSRPGYPYVTAVRIAAGPPADPPSGRFERAETGFRRSRREPGRAARRPSLSPGLARNITNLSVMRPFNIERAVSSGRT
jgi:dihydropteroate synthase